MEALLFKKVTVLLFLFVQICPDYKTDPGWPRVPLPKETILSHTGQSFCESMCSSFAGKSEPNYETKSNFQATALGGGSRVSGPINWPELLGSPGFGGIPSLFSPTFLRDLELRNGYKAQLSNLKQIPCSLKNLPQADYYWSYCLGSPCTHGYQSRIVAGHHIVCPASFEAFNSSKNQWFSHLLEPWDGRLNWSQMFQKCCWVPLYCQELPLVGW